MRRPVVVLTGAATAGRSCVKGRFKGGSRTWRTGPHRLRLYVAGSGPRSLRAVQNIKRVCDAELPGRYSLEVVDIYKEPGRAAEDQIVAIPTLIKQAPGLVRRMIGDLSETAVLRQGLGLGVSPVT